MKVTITLTDIDDGQVELKAEFDPSVKRVTQSTPAQTSALDILQYVHSTARNVSSVKVRQ